MKSCKHAKCKVADDQHMAGAKKKSVARYLVKTRCEDVVQQRMKVQEIGQKRRIENLLLLLFVISVVTAFVSFYLLLEKLSTSQTVEAPCASQARARERIHYHTWSFRMAAL